MYANQINQNDNYLKLKECEQQSAGGTLGGSPMPTPSQGLEHSLQALRGRIDSLNSALQHLNGKLTPAMYPQPPEAASQTGKSISSSAPLLALLDAESERVLVLLQIADAMINRLIF